MKKLTTLLIFLFCISKVLCQSGNNYSHGVVPLQLGYNFTNQTNLPNASGLNPGNDYGCLSSTANPSWYYFGIQTSGFITLSISTNDYEFIVYGPFASYADMMSHENAYGVNPGAPLFGCGNSSFPLTMNATVGEFYMILLCNVNDDPGNHIVYQSFGSGVIDSLPFPSYNHHFLRGDIYYDYNQNGQKDQGEIGLLGAQVDISPVEEFSFTNSSGFFYYITDTNELTNYQVDLIGLSGWSPTTQTSYQFQLDTSDVLKDSLDFGLFPDSLFVDGTIDLATNSIQCVFKSDLFFTIQNNGTMPMTADFVLYHDSAFSYFNSWLPIDSANNNAIYISDIPVSYMNSNLFGITLSTDGTLNAGDKVCFQYSINCYDTTNQLVQTVMDSMCFEVECSYDPNDKTPFIDGYEEMEIIDTSDFIEYVINFENTGSSFAVNVEIIDTIPVELDLSTFEFVSSSHLVNFSIEPSTRVLTIRFNDILLPWTLPDSKGFFKFRIEQEDALPPNQTIENMAAIYFDYNAPIITNTTFNKIECYITPDFPDIQVGEDVLFTNVGGIGYSYQWYLDGQILSGETGHGILVQQTGVYTIVVSNDYGCTSEQDYNLPFLTLIENSKSNFVVYPNPSFNSINIRFEDVDARTIEVMDLMGKLVYRIELNADRFELNDNVIGKGVYWLNIKSSDGSSNGQRIIKL